MQKRLLAEALSERFGIALLEGDASDAERIARHAWDEGLDYALIHARVIAPALQRIGLMWERGEIGVAHEHLATQIALRVLALLRELARVERQRSDHRALFAAVQGEHHIVALQMSADLLEEAGYEPLMLGPDVPPDALADVIHDHEPHLVALTMTMQRGRQLAEALDAVRKAQRSAAVIIGGQAGKSRLPRTQGLAFADSVLDAVDLADSLIRRPDLN